MIAVQHFFKTFRIYPLCGKRLERKGIAHTYIQKAIELPAQSGCRVAQGRLIRRNVRRRKDPRQSRILIKHITAPSRHRDYSQIAPRRLPVSELTAIQPAAIDQQGQFPDSKAINVRYPILAYKGKESRLNVWSFYLIPAQRIGPVKDNHINAFLSAGLHHQAESTDKSIGPYSDILYIIHHYIYAVQHLRCRFARGTIQRKHRQTCRFIHGIGHFSACINIAPYSMFRAVKGHKLDLWRTEKYINC